MSAKRQHRRRRMQDEPRYVIGMDAHSRKLAISIWDWSDRFNACMHRELKCIDIDSMIKTYERNVNIDSITIIESSTNSASLKKMLNAAGYRAEIVRADVIANKERKRRICDIRDAENLALAYIKGDIDEFVWTPSQEYTQYRDIMFAYRDTTKEMTRLSNRIWNMCSRKGYKLPIRNSTNKVSILREMIIETKTALYRHVAAKQGKLFVNSSDELLMRKSAQIERETYGDTGTIAKGELVQSIPNMVLDLHSPHGHRYIKTKLIGGYNYHNAMAAIALGKFLDIDDETIAQAIEEYTPGNMRSQLIKSKSNTIILDAYNANPTSMTVAVTNFANMQHPNKIVILGEMRELGHREAEAHAELVNLVLEQNFSKIYFVGKPFENHKDRATNIIWTQNTEGLIELLKEEKPENSIIFVKGSRGNRLERIVEHL